MRYRCLGGFFILLGMAALLAGCAGSQAPVAEGRPRPQVYRVMPGDTLGLIAERYRLDYRDITAWNRLQSPDLIYPGQRLWLKPPPLPLQPEAAPPSPPAPPTQTPPTVAAAKPKAAPPAKLPLKTAAKPEPPRPADNPVVMATVKPAKPALAAGRLAWLWPTRGTVVRGYDPAVPGRKGIQISGKPGQPVMASSPGQVVYSGSGLPGYGRLIIVKHSDSLLSAYGYLGKIYVREGDTVKSGQAIAELGAGHENRPVLHFEIRRNGRPVDPLAFLSG